MTATVRRKRSSRYAGWSKRTKSHFYLVIEATYEPTDPTIDTQITSLQGSGADVLVVAAAPKFAAQSIRKVHDLNWKPMFIMCNVSISVGSVITPAGSDNAIGLIS